MKLLFIGDPHLKISRFELSKSFLKWVNEMVLEHNPDLLINLGDTFDTHAVVRSELMSEFRKHVLQVTKHVPYMYVLGNHDMYKPNDSKYHSLQTMADIPNFHVIDKPKSFSNAGITIVPYQHDASAFPTETLPICIAHQTFMGADFGFYRPENGVDSATISADLIVSGHIHKRQMFGKVIYPGTPYAQGIDDINQSKGLMMLDTETLEYIFIESPFPKWRGMKFDIREMTINDVHESLVSELNDSDNWVLEMTGPKAEIVGYLSSEQFLNVKGSRSIRIKPEYTDTMKRENTQIKSITPINIIEEYVDKIYSGTLDKGKIKTIAQKIFSEVK